MLNCFYFFTKSFVKYAQSIQSNKLNLFNVKYFYFLTDYACFSNNKKKQRKKDAHIADDDTIANIHKE